MVKKAWMIIALSAGLFHSAQATQAVTEQALVQGYLQQQSINQWLADKHQALEARRQGVALWANPQLELSYEPSPSVDGNDETESSLWLTQQLGAWGARGYQRDAADYQTLLGKQQLQLALRDNLLELKADFYHLVLLRDLHQQYQQWQQQMNQLVDASAAQLKAGEQAALDHFRLQQEASHAALQLAEVEQQVHQLSAKLEQQTGLRMHAVSAELLPSNMTERAAQLNLPSSFLELDMMQLERAQLTASQQAQASKALPEVSVGVGLRQLEVNQESEQEMAFKIGMSLPIFDRGQHQATALTHEIAALDIEAQRLRKRLVTQFNTLKLQLTAAVRALSRSQLTETQNMLHTATDAYWLGELSVAELIDIQRSAVELTEKQLSNQLAARTYYLQLQALTTPLPEIKP